MVQFLLCVLQYVIIMIALAVIGFVGGFVGFKIRGVVDAKKAAKESENE